MPIRVQSVDELRARVAEDPALRQQLVQDPDATLSSIIVEPLRTDVWIYRVVVSALGLTVLLSILGAILLAVVGNEIPEVLTALGSAAVGALAGLLAPSPASQRL